MREVRANDTCQLIQADAASRRGFKTDLDASSNILGARASSRRWSEMGRMSGSQLIRLAEKADVAELQAIERAAATLFPEGRIPDVNDAMPICELEKAVATGLLLVATSQNLVVGFAMAQEQDGLLHLAVMAVRPDHGNRGLGRKLLLAVIHEAARRKHAGVTLTTFDDLPWNGPFYRKAGFRVLRDSELSPSLRNILAQEEDLGMVNRVAMHHAIAV